MSRQLYVFGSNGEGQLGIPAADIVDEPVKVLSRPSLANIRSIIGGYNHSLLCTTSGPMFGAGDNRKGQLFHDSAKDTPSLDRFILLQGNVPFAAATCESSAYITNLERSSSICTQGAGLLGELGRGPEIQDLAEYESERNMPLGALPSPTIDFAAGVWHYIVVLDDGSVFGWGKARLGQLGSGLEGKVAVPTLIEGIPFKPVRVVCGKDFTYLVGEPSTGEHIVLGKDKFNIASSRPSTVKGWKDIGATWHSIFVLFEDGTITAWGRNSMWELIPPNLPRIEKIAVGSEHVLAVTKEGTLISWGWGKHGNCGSLVKVQDKVKNDMVNGFWNEINLPGKVEMIAAGYCTSFVVTNESPTTDDIT